MNDDHVRPGGPEGQRSACGGRRRIGDPASNTHVLSRVASITSDYDQRELILRR